MLERKAGEKQHLLALAVYSDLKESMLEGKPRSTLKLMDSLLGASGIVRWRRSGGMGRRHSGCTETG